MKRLIFVLLLAAPAFAADFEAGIRHVVVNAMGETGELDLPMSRGFAATGEVFWTERISTQLAATFVNPEAILFPQDSAAVDLGTLGLDIYSVTARYHFTPRARFSAYAGGGAALVAIGNLDDQFGEEIEIEFGNETTFVAEGGVRYRFLPRLFIDVSVSYMPLTAEAESRRGARGPAELTIDPLAISGGLSWRF